MPTTAAPPRGSPMQAASLRDGSERWAKPRLRGSAAGRITFIPMFYAALCFLAGIIAVRLHPLRASFLLIGVLLLAVTALIAIWKAPRMTWTVVALLWTVLGAWSAEMQPSPSPNPVVIQLADGLLRTVEGTVVDAGPMRTAEQDEDDDTDSGEGAASGRGFREATGAIQRLDLQLTAAETVTDEKDAVVPVEKDRDARIRLSLHWPEAVAPALQCGDTIRAVVRVQTTDVYHDPGVWSRAEWLESQDVTAGATLDASREDGPANDRQPRFTLLDSRKQSSGACLLNRLRNLAIERLQTLPAATRGMPAFLRAMPEDTAMLTALLTGDRSFLTRSLRGGFERTGSFHLIVVSGLHLAILAGCVFALAKRLRLPRLPATVLTVGVSLAYAFFTGFAVPAQRSFWMITLYLAGRLLYRNRRPLNVIGFALVCLAVVSPRSIFDASLQMTVLSVTAIAGIAMPLLEQTLHARSQATKRLRLVSLDPSLPPGIAQFRVTMRLFARHMEAATSNWVAWKLMPGAVRYTMRLAELIFITLVVELALALPMAIYFHRITVYALPVNLLILPLLTLLVPAAMVTLLVLAIWPAAAVAPAAVTLALLHFSLGVVRTLGGMRFGDIRVPEPTVPLVAVALLSFVAAILLARGGKKSRRLVLPALGLMVAAAIWPRPTDHPRTALLFEAIDVGQGDSLLLISPDGKTLLIDGGGIGFQGSARGALRAQFDTGEDVVSPVLWSRGIRRLDAVALTHAHHDHLGGLPAILTNFRPAELWVGNNPPVPAYLDLLQVATSHGVRVRSLHAGDSVALGQVQIAVLAAGLGYRSGAEARNDDSLVLRAHYGATSILLAGDAEGPEEQAILHSRAEWGLHPELDPRSTVLKVGHHGSLTSTGPDFLAEVNPQCAVISCGRRNRFGHPRGEILGELQTAHVRTFRTDLTGATCLLLDGQKVTPQPLCSEGLAEGP